jgi:hypothetical protein
VSRRPYDWAAAAQGPDVIGNYLQRGWEVHHDGSWHKTATKAPPVRYVVETERDFSSWVLDLAHLRGWATYHTWLSMHSARGWPDLALVRPPRLAFAELKTEKGKPTKAQAYWLELLGQAGAEAYLWRPSDRDRIEEILA